MAKDDRLPVIYPLDINKTTLSTGWPNLERGGDKLRTRVDPETISRLSKLCDRLKRNNGLIESMEDLMDVGNIPNASPFQDNSDEKSISQTEGEIRKIESMQRTLQKLSSCMDMAHLKATRRLERLRSGSLHIPDEILSQILLFAAHCNPDHVFHSGNVREEMTCAFQSAVDHSHVCKRFRLVSLETPMLWNRICDNMSADFVGACLKRSGITLLEIFLNPFARPTLKHGRWFQAFIEAISGSEERWSRFTLYKASSLDLRASLDDLEPLEKSFGNLVAPQLESLEIHSPRRFSRMDMHQSVRLRRFYESWQTPKLKALIANQFVPLPFSSEATKLRSLDLTLGDQSLGNFVHREVLDVEPLHRFLAACPLLEELRLTMCRLVEPEFLGTQVRTLSCVKSVSLSFRSCTDSFIRSIFGVLNFPAATELSLSLALEMAYTHELRVMAQAVLGSNKFPLLTKMELDIQGRSGGSEPISFPFSLLGNIRDLTLSVDKSVVLQPPKGRVPPLRSLYLKNFGKSKSGLDWVDSFLSALTDQGDLEELKELRTESGTIDIFGLGSPGDSPTTSGP